MRAIASLPHAPEWDEGVGVSAAIREAWSPVFMSVLLVAPRSADAEGEGRSHRAQHDLPGHAVMERGDGLDAGAVLRHDVVEPELLEGVDDLGDALVGEPAQVEPADHRV